MLVQDAKINLLDLNKRSFGEFEFIFRINDGFSIKVPSKINNKYQLLFKKIESKVQQLNLIFVDSIFVNILADVTLDVFINNIRTFNQYIESKSRNAMIAIEDESVFLKAKFNNFAHLLLYGDITANKPFMGQYLYERVYCLKEENKEIEYFSIYNQSILQAKLLNSLSLKIDLEKTFISDKELHLILKIVYE
jgi:hypothetical protein